MRAPIILTLLSLVFSFCPLALAATNLQTLPQHALPLNALPHNALQSSAVPALEFQSMPSTSGAKVETGRTHMLVLKCPSRDGFYRGSRVTVLDMSGEASARPDMDIALVTGHGLIGPDGEIAAGCFVQDFSGRSTEVRGLRLAPDYRAGTEADWGLIQFQRMKTPGLIRYPLRAADLSLLETSADQGTYSRFASARGRSENGQSCAILPPPIYRTKRAGL